MGRIKKAATERHMATLSPFIKDFVKQATEVPLYQLPALLESFPQLWPFPRGDLYHWIPVLDRFDHILELFCKEYALNEGPQTQPFEQRLLQKGDAEENMPYSSVGGRAQELGEAGFSVDGDRELVEAILQFSRVLLEKCGNRSLYASSGHINDLLNTTSLNLLRLCLKLSLRLAQRYQVARYKNHHPSAQAVLLANHYNINLESLHKIAMPFPKPYSLPASAGQTPATKGKERSTSAVAFNPADLVAIAKEPISTQLRQDLSNVALSYYEPSQSVTRPDTAPQAPDASPASPSIARRTSNLGPSRDRPAVGDRSANDVSSTPVKSRESDETPSSAPKIFQIPADEVAERSACSLLHDALPNVPKDSRYDLLNRVRIAKAFASQETTPQQLLEVRLLAIANLASAYNESKFQEKIGAPDGEEPRRFHLAQQLCDLLQPATANQMSLTLQSEITVLSTLEALSKSRHKVTEVADALGVTVNHGALYYELRKVVASLHAEEHSTKKAELIESEWRDAAFELVNNLQQTHMSQRYGERLVTSGVMAILIEPLSLRTTRAERFHEKVLQFFDSVVHNVPSGFQTLADVKGLDIIADLTAYEVDGALENVRTGRGLPSEYKSKVVDYAIPFHQQATLRQLFKNTVHMFEQHNAGTHDRLLRNLIDTPQILGALRNVIENAQVFGANVWSGAVNIVSNFIHNEPTSYQVIGEAGLSKSLLESITGNKVPDELPSLEDFVPSQETPEIKATESGDPSYPSVPGILPIGEVLCDIPNAFGAICLNESGMQLFQASGALSKYFDVFLSPQHVRAMEDEGQTAATIGHSFDELSRHHPRLKDQIMAAVINMLKRLKELCAILAAKKHSGAKLWQAVDGKIAVSGGQAALEGAARAELDQAISGGGELAPPQSSTPIEDDGTEDARERATAAPYLSACFKFLDTFCQNASMCTLFCEESGAELLLDLAVSPSIPYDLVAFPLFNKSSQVLKSMCEAKAHLVLPSIIRRMQHALLSLRWLMGNKRPASSFRLFTDLSEPTDSGLPNGIDGTTVVKSLVNVHLLTHVLGRILAPPTYSLRHHPASNALFSSLNFTEIYLEFVDQLSQLHASCVWESLLLMHDLPDARKAGTEPRPFIMRRTDANGIVEIAGEKNAEAARGEDAASGSNERQSRQSVLAQKNLRTIRYLLNQVPMGIESFLHSLGQAIATKGNNSKEHGTAVSRRIAKALTWELDFRRDAVVDESLETKYIASILAMIGRMLLRNSYSMEAFGTKEALNTVLRDFYLAGGLTRMNDGLERFVGLLAKQQEDGKIEGHVRDALHSILNFYNQIVRQKCIHETTQQQPRLVQTDKKAADYFNASQLILEARDAILPAVSKIWHSKEIEKINDSDVKLVVDILQLILKADGEDHSHRRVEHAMRRPVPEDPSFTFTPKENDSVHKLETAVGVDASLAAEALYRCNHHVAAAEAYSRLRLKDDQVPRFPVPQETEVKAQLTPAKAQDTSEDAEMADASKDDSMPGLEAVAEMTSGAENPISSNDHSTEQMQPHVTKEDLDEKRTEVRDDLIDRCLEVLSTQPSLTFELADLIQAAVANAGDGSNARADIGTTLVLSLMSLHGQEPSKEYGAKIHAYAHLVGLILQDREFFDSILDELKESFETLVSWVQLEQDQKIEDAPWVETILLIVERVLAEDEQPTEVEWRAPPSDDPLKPMPLPPAADLVVSTELRSQLFDALVEMLPKIGKNKSLALSVSRVLVILTRRRDLAARLSDKPRMGRLFLMVRQLAGFSDEKVQSSLLLILRHLVEDEDMIRQIMRAEVRVLFENHRSSRAVDTTTYAKNMHHLVLRSPQIFVEVTQEMLEIARFDGTPQRAQTLALKKPPLPTFDAPEDSTTDANAPSTSNAETSDADARKSIEPKPPVVEGNDGVIQFLLRELTNYRDVEDKPALAAKDSQGDDTLDTSSTDVEMTDAVAATGNAVPEASSQSKTAFKAEEHPIFVYRCFLLQCLAELLSSYNRTKVEFINFSRTKPEPPATTPSKPRAGTLRYLLETLLPVGTLEHRDDVAHRKRVATSHWANAVLVALCTKTQERHLKDAQDPSKFAEQEPELTFVRKFVCEHALKSFANAMGGPSPVDERYSRLLALGELFNRMLNDKVDLHRSNLVAAGMYAAQQQIGRLMYERGFIGTLTSAIAELDLNFPNAKRTVKYILNPLKHLTDLGVAISQSSDSSTEPGASTEEDDISSATSEDDEDEREQTPDMYRGSSLGIFEAAGNEDDESDSESADEDEDEEMYEEAYDEEMEYDEEPAAEHGDVVSDEDDDGMDDDMGEIEGVPGDIEMQLDIVEDDDDEDEDEEDSDDEEEDDDSGGDIDFADQMDEITGDDENASMNEHDEGDWEDDFHGHGAPHDGGSPHGGPLEHIAHVLGAEDPSEAGDQDGVVHIDMGGEEEFFEDEMPPEDEEDEDEIDYGEDMIYEPEMEDDEDEEEDGGWAWDANPVGMGAPAILRGGHVHHHHHHHRGFPEMFSMMAGEGLRPTGAGFRSHHRSTPNARDEDGINPLLQRDSASANAQRDRDSLDMHPRGPRRALLPRGGDAILQDIVAAVGPAGHGGGGIVNINVDGAVQGLSALPPMFAVQHGQGGAHAMIDLDPRRSWRDQLSLGRWPDMVTGGRSAERNATSHSEVQAVEFRVATTTHRWQEEARMLFPGGKAQEKAVRIANRLLRALVPAAMEAKRVREKKEAQRRAAEEKAAEEARKKLEAEKAEREAQEKKEREEREAREREEAEMRAREEAEEAEQAAAEAATEAAQVESEAQGDAESSMEGVEHDAEAGTSDEPSTEAPQDDAAAGERVTINIRGRELDITSLGIDREYIEALPEDMREEVVMAQVAEQRSQQVESGEGPSEISREFLEALPREIQQELIRSEQMERRRREREETRRRATQEGAAAQPEEMNNADFMAMLDPTLRRAILMEADDSVLSALPEELQAEARALFGDRRPRGDAAGRLGRGLEPAGARVLNGQLGARHTSNAEYGGREVSRQRRPVAQMLDKAGIATLLRLMFVSLNHKSKSNLHSILSDVCKNTQNRAEVISILLAILQDGTSDVNAVERSFAQLSLRAKTPPSATPRTPQPPKRTLTAPITELSPLNIVQQCLGTLNALSNDNQRVNSFFLSEHETSISQKTKAGKKGKGPESKAVKYPLNALLTLLDRKLITENTSVMETLASLLSTVTRPLTMLLRRAKEAQDEAEKAKTETETTAATDERPETSTSDVPMEEATPAEEQPSADAESSVNANDAPSAEATNEGKAEADPQTEVEDKKKHRDLVPPEVPDENIRLVVNILAARECPSKTFSDTLDIIKNMSAIPGAKEVFGKELIRQAQELGQALLEGLDDLAKHINAAETGTDVQGMALASFSSAGAKQRRLLRVLVALDHLFDPKRMPQAQPTSPNTSGSDIDQQLKEEILATLYESATFDKLWQSLSACLTAIRQRGNMVNIATILLPLIESLMVVCRNSTLKETAESSGTPPPPEARMETLFFNFTEDHRKILNELVRNNPKLMNGNLSVMAKNSKVLEFDNKRNYFSRQLRDRRAEVRVPHPSLQLSVRRDNVFLDSFKSLYFKTPDEIKFGKLNIRFHGEEGIDAGGVSREWFAAMARQMFNPDYALFNPVASDRTTFHPNSLSQVNPEHLMFFKFIGRIIGKALYENRVLDCHFSRAVYRKILGKSVSLKDMETLDLDYYKSLVWMLENDITDVAFETFSFEVDKFGVTETVDLMPGGRDIAVTEENKHEYVRLVVEYKLLKSVQEQLDHFLEGFHEIIPSHLISIFNEQELELLISGLPDIDVDDWKNNTEYHNYQPTSAQIQWFWRAVRSFDKEEKAKLLQFVTGTSKVPLNGFKELEGMNGHAKFNIHRDYSSKEKLPSSHTCFNQLDLPEYESYEHLRQQLYTAITAGSEYFGFA